MAGATRHCGHELVKLVGAVLFVPGILLLFWQPAVAFVFLIPAVILSLLSLIWTREQKDIERKEAEWATPRTAPPRSIPPRAPTPAERLKELKSLHVSGLLTDDEYEQKRKAIVDEM